MLSSATTIEVPSALALAIDERVGLAALPRWAVEALVAEGVRESLLSVGEAADILGFGYFEAEAFLKEKGVGILLSDEQLAHDRSDLQAMFPDLASR